jgi:mRNA interferase MazF
MNGQVKLTREPIVISDLTVNQGDIVVVPFPYTDRQTEKRRPALVISNNRLTEQYNLVWLAMITSAENKRWINDIELGLGDSGLSALSLIRIAKLATVDSSRIIRVAGKVSTEIWTQVLSTLNSNLK